MNNTNTNNTIADSSALRRHHQRRSEAVVPPQVDHKDGAPAAQREKITSSLLFDRQVGFRKETVAPEPSKNRVLERKPTEDINQSAEAFINKFRQQLLLQRLESIENYEQMIRRGAAP